MSNFWFKLGIISSYLLLVIVMMYIFVFMMISSFRYVNKFGTTSEYIASKPFLLPDSMQGAGFLNARILLQNEDSVSLVVSLPDSLIALDYKGVTLHKVKISGIASSHIFKRIGAEGLAKGLSVPLIIEQQQATIPKVQFHVIMAPDSANTEWQANQPDSSQLAQQVVCFAIKLNNGIILEIRQSENKGGRLADNYDRRLKNQYINRIVKDLAAFRVPEYQPVVLLEIPQKDAKTIYKALPKQGRVALKI